MTPRAPAATALAVGLLLAGCTPTPTPDPATTPSASPTPSASASASPSPTTTLAPAKQKAVNQATDVILAYEQLRIDLFADPTPRLNDLNDLVTDPQLELDINSMSMLLRDQETVIESAGPVTIAAVEPVKINLKGDPPTVTLLVCLDKTAVSGTYKGDQMTGPRSSLRYRVVKTTYLPAPGWAVAKVLPPQGHDQPQPC